MSVVSTEVTGDAKVLANIAEMTARAKDARPATRKVREIMVESEKKTFESEGSHIGKPWAPLAQATIDRKSRENLDPRPLHGKTGALEASLSGGKGKRTGATKATARAGSGIWYSVFARGTRSGEPRRDLAGLSHEELQKVFVAVAEYVVQGKVP